jgi:chemotaxis protein CheY-P-specific phosphatase CheC
MLQRELQEKLFSEWAKVGFSNAAAAMSNFMSLPVVFSEPTIIFTDISNLIRFVNDHPGDPSVCLLQGVKGGLDGFFLFSAPPESVSSISKSIQSTIFDSSKLNLKEVVMEQSIMNEWVNIFSGNLLSSIESKNLDLLELTSAEQTYDMSGAAMDFIACQMAVDTDLVALSHTKLKIAVTGDVIDVWIVINPNSKAFKSNYLNQ